LKGVAVIASNAPSNKLTLYDISLEGMLIADILTENEGELTPELEARLDDLMRAAPDRIEAAAMVLRQFETNAAICKHEIERLNERKASFENQADKLKERIRLAVDAAFNGKVKTPRFTIWTQKAADSVAFDLAEEFTLEMLQQDHPALVKTELKLDKAAIKAIYERQPDILPEAIFVDEKEGSRYLRVK
jgi:hypothetical protein